MNWPKIKFGELGSWSAGGTPPRSERKYFGGEIPWASIADLNDEIVSSTRESLTPLGIEKSSAKVYPKNSLLIAMYGSIGKLGINSVPMASSQAIACFIPNHELITLEYSKLVLQFMRPQLLNLGQGGTQKNISQKILKSLEVPLPPLEEQKRIAGILEASSRQRKYVQDEITFFETLRDHLVNQFSSVCTEFKCLNEIAEISTGATPSRKNHRFYDGSVPWVKTAEVTGVDIEETEEHISDIALEQTNCRVFRAGTTLIAMYGQGATRGRSGFLVREMATNQACAAVTPLEKEDDRYVFNLIKSSYGALRASGRGGTQPNLNLKIVKDFQIPYPSKRETRLELVNSCEAVGGQVQALNKKRTLLEELHQSLAMRAFAGEL